MHGLINRSIQNYVVDRFGEAAWRRTANLAELESPHFESMMRYDDAITPRVLTALSSVLDRPLEDLMEDLGTHMVTNPNVVAVRRLLRFSGVNFEDFLHSLDDLPARARLAVADLEMPAIELHAQGDAEYKLLCDGRLAGFGHVMMGILRAMADDYGALAFLEHCGQEDGKDAICISLVEANFTPGNEFELGAQVE